MSVSFPTVSAFELVATTSHVTTYTTGIFICQHSFFHFDARVQQTLFSLFLKIRCFFLGHFQNLLFQR